MIPEQLAASVRHHWWLFLLRGVVANAFGVLTLTSLAMAHWSPRGRGLRRCSARRPGYITPRCGSLRREHGGSNDYAT